MMKKFKERIEVREIYRTNKRILFRIVEDENMRTGEIIYESRQWGIIEAILKYREQIEKDLVNNKGKVIFVMIEDGEVSKIL